MNTEFYVVGYSDFNDNFYFVQKVTDKLITVCNDEKSAVKFDDVELAKDCLNVVENIAANSNYDIYKSVHTMTKVVDEPAEPTNNSGENAGENAGENTGTGE